MIRAIHRWPGLLALALVTMLAVSGAMLSVFPAAHHVTSPQAGPGMSVATLASRVQATYPGIMQIRRGPSGRITAYWFDQNEPGSAIIDPTTGQGVASADPNRVERWLTEFHRSLFLGDNGRIAMAVGAGAMLIMSISGALLVARRTGGWRRWFTRLRGPLSGRIHVEIARVAAVGFALSSITALYMTASTFSFLPDTGAMPGFPAQLSGEMGLALTEMPALADVRVANLRELNFPYPDDPTDVFTLQTSGGMGFVDQGTGALMNWTPLTTWQRVTETIYMLHTGQGAAILGLVLGLLALGIPVMGVTGVLVWLSGRRGRPRIRHNAPASRAETIVLVGSEGGSTWGFAATLHAALTARGQHVHAAPMSSFAPQRYAQAKRIIVLAATYGDGDAPSSAKGFLARLASVETREGVPMAVLGFGDRSFPAFCAFARTVSDTAEAQGWREALPMDSVDRQSPQDFARWGRALGQTMGLDLELHHQPVLPASESLTLISRRDYGVEVQAPTAILRFSLPRTSLWRRLTGAGFARFEAGDLIGILPEGSPLPRFYSLGSSRRDGFVEIVVKKHSHGLCSGQLTALEPGDTVTAFLRRNPGFRAGRGRTPLILIGAGTGIGPLAGFVRGNGRHRPIHLFFGMRHPDSDFFYSDDLSHWQQEHRLSRLVTAVSRGMTPAYVQDALRGDASEVVRLIESGARIMVCGGRGMAEGVTEALATILAPTGLTPATLKAEGRYVEDVY